MLKGIVSGSPVDIKRIAMKGENLWQANASQFNNSGGTGTTYKYFGMAQDFVLSVTAKHAMASASLGGLALGITGNGGNASAGASWTISNNEWTEGQTRYVRSRTSGYMFVSIYPALKTMDEAIAWLSENFDIMLNLGSTALPYEPYGMQPGWEVRDQQGTILWGADKTLTGTDSISFKGYALPLKSYEIEANMEQAASQAYTIEGTSSIDYQSDGTAIALQIVGNEVQKSPNLADPSKTVPGYQDYDGSIHEPSSANEITTDYIPFTDTIYIIVSGSQSGNINWVAYDENKQALYFYGPSFNPNETITVTPQSASCAFIRVSWTNGANQPICITNEPQPGYVAYNGTPTPTVPIQPEECGERTGNLFDKTATTVYNAYFNETNTWISSDDSRSVVIPVNGGTQYTLSVPEAMSVFRICEATQEPVIGGTYYRIVRASSAMDRYTFTTRSDAKYIIFQGGRASLDAWFNGLMLNLGQTALPYEPYGYKIPFSNGNTTYNVYLSEPLRKIGDYGDTVSSDGTVVRRVKKIVLDGTESWIEGTSNYYILIDVSGRGEGIPNSTALSTHTESGVVVNNNGTALFFKKSVFVHSSLADFKAFLTQQYQNGTPVEVWYVLANETTEQTAFPTVTPTQGANTLSVSTTLAPSKTRLTATSGVWPKNPIEPEEFGDLVTSGEHAGQYKIPITNSGQTYNIFLNEPLRKIGTYADKVRSDGVVERKIKKLVLTGQETWAYGSLFNTAYATWPDDHVHDNSDIILCSTHYAAQLQVTSSAHVIDKTAALNVNDRTLYIRDTAYDNSTDFKAFLAEQYVNGTPVTVWYVLNTPTTESITAPEIATTQGTNTLTVDTTLIPSSTEITLHAKPIRFGFKIDKTNDNSDTAVTYTYDAVTMTPAAMNFTTGVFDYGSWANAWFVRDAYPVALNLDGTEAYRLDPDDYTKKTDGTASDIQFILLTEEPSDWSTQWKQYYTKDANDNYELNAQSEAPTFALNTYYRLSYGGFQGNFMVAFPRVYFRRTEDATYNYVEISNHKLGDDWCAYAHINSSGNEVKRIYLPLFKGVIVDSKLRSVPGVIPQGGTNATTEVNAATALGSRWQIWDHSSVECINDLLVLMSKSIDSQGKFGKGRESGYNSSDTVTYGKLQTGTLVKGGKFKGFSSSYKEVKVFGIEGFWANRWDRLQGMLLVNNVWKIKMTPPYNFTGTDFVTLSNASVPTGNGYLSKVQTSQYGSIPASIEGGLASKFYKDYFYKTATDTRVALRGGLCNYGARCGFRSVGVYYAASNSNWSIGASPVYK